MYSKLVFSENKGDSLNDNILHTYELYGLNLNADLAVLSACNTSTGKIETGEGIFNIARGFLYAGCPSVITTLWQVEDKSSAKLNSNLYKYLKDGHSKAKALQLSKLDHLNSSVQVLAHPLYWAGYINVGNPNPITTIYWHYIIISFALLLLASAIFLWLIKRKQKV